MKLTAMAWNSQYKGTVREQTKHVPYSASSPGKARLPIMPWYIERPPTKIQTATGTRILPGRLVPVIFADQLPEWLEIKGIPRELKREQVADFTALGLVPGGDTHEVSIFGREVHFDSKPTSATGLSVGVGEQMHANADTSLNHQSKRDNEAQKADREIRKDGECTVMVKGNTGALHQRLPSPPPEATSHENPYQMAFYESSLAIPSEPKTIYCLYYTKNGFCREGSACGFKHEMPETKEELQKVGISNNFPAWYREKKRKEYRRSIKNKRSGLKQMEEDYLRRLQVRCL
ncbi:hypothetical protein F5Y18DRAFT_32417 [Xylariaceae sp. FL1019]|nr:hypothetical protein F5Y18DRAFT_32417 [Xylariaceae sp. FL1019]